MAAKQASTLPANEAAVSFEALTSNLGQTTVGFVVDGKPYQATVAIDIMEGLKYTAGGPTEAPRCRIENIDHVVDAASWVIFSTRNVATKHW